MAFNCMQLHSVQGMAAIHPSIGTTGSTPQTTSNHFACEYVTARYFISATWKYSTYANTICLPRRTVSARNES